MGSVCDCTIFQVISAVPPTSHSVGKSVHKCLKMALPYVIMLEHTQQTQLRMSADVWGWEVLKHHPSSPDLSPWDFNLTAQLKQPLHGTQFANREDILTAAQYLVAHIIIIIIIQYGCLLSQAFLPGTSLEPVVILTAQASSFTLQYFPYYVWCSKYSCLL